MHIKPILAVFAVCSIAALVSSLVESAIARGLVSGAGAMLAALAYQKFSTGGRR